MSSDLSNEKKHAGGQIIVVMVIFFLLMVVVTAWAVYYAIANRVELFNNDSNPRETLLAERIDRGTIYAADGSVLAENDESGTRVYPYGRVFAHVVGYSAMGGSGIEEYCKYDLLHSNVPFMEKVECDKEGVKYPGDNITTTLVPKLQQAAYDAMGYYEGAIIVTEVRTGKILAMVSKPDYDPSYIARDWNFYLEEDDEGTLVNRATQGQYPPGSTFKIVDVVELLQEHPDADSTYHFSCSGSFSQDGESITCYDHDVHGEEDLTAAFANSCNSAFASIGLSLDRRDYMATLKRLMFNGKLPYDLPYNTSKLDLTTDISTREMIQVSIGQGTTQMSPLHLNMITSAVANHGVLMKPYLVDHRTDADGRLLDVRQPEEYGELMSSEIAAKLRTYMRAVITDGTATVLRNQSYNAAGKTGSAEFNDELNSHSWFTGFAPAEDPKICVTCIIEGQGTGSRFAVPAAKVVFDAYFND